ncbi:hypothetical protein FGO68_gene12568 [Halteria grandinella]|uniref:Uncharacterized protein n=1 Tax=Halteria grandinella TaxID=5974 RepID=A0A8J8T9U8_HALGN|nr:hypothetical protein FGO68_gene12568 [Halteria grandinella]
MWRCGIAYNSQPIQTLLPLSQYSASILIYIFINLLLLINNRTKVKYYFLINFSQTLFRPYFHHCLASSLHFTSMINLQKLFISLQCLQQYSSLEFLLLQLETSFVNVVHSRDRSGESNIPHRLSRLQKLRHCEIDCFQ